MTRRPRGATNVMTRRRRKRKPRKPSRYPGSWNVWHTMTDETLDSIFNVKKPAHRQLLDNEIGDYPCPPELRAFILEIMRGLPLRALAIAVHGSVCPECINPVPKEILRNATRPKQLSLFGD